MDPESPPTTADEPLLRPVEATTWRFRLTVTVLLAFVLVAFIAWVYQLRSGLGVTGLQRPVFWGIYITNFVFFIGISHAGTLISAILRICKAEWRRSITRSAEVITVMVLFFGVANIIADIGRPDRALYVLEYGSFSSPLLWDVTSISVYLMASVTYLYLPLIPDIAILRDRGRKRTWLYRMLALGWRGTDRQWRILNRLIAVMAVLVIPIAVSVHTVVSWVFAMTIQPMWHSTIFGPYFVVGAIFSGIAALIIAMAIIRRVFRLEAYFKTVHFRNLGIMLLVMSMLWLYFTFAEHLTVFYGAEPAHLSVLDAKLWGAYAPWFWTMVTFCFVVPFTVLAVPRFRTVTGVVIASATVTVGMWIERFTIVVPTLVNPRLPYEVQGYHPTWVELAITVGCFAAFILFYVIFVKLFPIVSIWEIQEGRAEGVKEAEKRVKSYLPDAERPVAGARR